jgi:NADH-quinone oxidoreductase subunit H
MSTTMTMIVSGVLAFLMLNITLVLASFCTWFERKGSALIQNRVGANRAGAFVTTEYWLLKPLFWVLRWLGILGVINTLFCDSLKGILKEDFLPQGTSQLMHCLGPFLAVLPIFLAFALIPLAPEFQLFGMMIRPQVAQLDAGVLFIFAMGSIAVYGVALAGWTGNNKYSLLGALRASAQMISYELAMGVVFVTLAVHYQTLDLYSMVKAQGTMWWGVVSQPLSFFILFIVGMAETKRGPFDLPESESEIVAGYFTEYSGMKFLIFWLGEFAEIALFAFVLSLVFFGGWNLPFIALPEGVWWAALIGHVVLMAKVLFFCMLQITIRWTLPRFRFDQLMKIGWIYLLPLSLVNLMVTAVIKVAFLEV